MTRTTCRSHERPGLRACGLALVALTMTWAASTAAASAPSRDGAAGVHAGKRAGAAKHVVHARKHASGSRLRHTAATAADGGEAPDELSLSDEFDRAELIERMLAECKGIPYNAYELAQTSGEALKLPAPIQLMTVRVHHPYCAELLRTYGRKIRV